MQIIVTTGNVEIMFPISKSITQLSIWKRKRIQTMFGILNIMKQLIHAETSRVLIFTIFFAKP